MEAAGSTALAALIPVVALALRLMRPVLVAAVLVTWAAADTAPAASSRSLDPNHTIMFSAFRRTGKRSNAHWAL